MLVLQYSTKTKGGGHDHQRFKLLFLCENTDFWTSPLPGGSSQHPHMPEDMAHCTLSHAPAHCDSLQVQTGLKFGQSFLSVPRLADGEKRVALMRDIFRLRFFHTYFISFHSRLKKEMRISSMLTATRRRMRIFLEGPSRSSFPRACCLSPLLKILRICPKR